MTKKVLCYSINSYWKLHAQWEFTILHNLRQCGADVRVVMCDGLYSDCDLFWKTSNPRSAYSCLLCQARNTETALHMLTDYQWLGRYLQPGDFNAARQWEKSLKDEEMEEASFEGWPLGEYVHSSFNSHFRAVNIDYDDSEMVGTYRSYLYSAAVAVRGLSALLDEYDPDVIFLFNGRQSSTRVLFELARHRGIRVIVHERGNARETLSFWENETCMGIRLFQDAWEKWGKVPLSSRELDNLQEYLHQREFGNNTSWLAWSPPPQDIATVYSELNLDPSSPVWILFTTSEDEVAAHADWVGDFSDQMTWINQTVDYFREHPEIQLVIRVHPNTDGLTATGPNPKGAKEFVELSKRVPENVRVVQPGDPVSTYTLMELSQCGLVYTSLTCIEMACKGKRVLIAGGGPSDMPLVTRIDDADNYNSILEKFHADATDKKDLELQRLAYRYAYALFFRLNHHFSLVTMPTHTTGKLNYSSLLELAPGENAVLDRIAEIVLNDAPVVPVPRLAELHRSENSERRWFDQLNGAGHCTDPNAPSGEDRVQRASRPA